MGLLLFLREDHQRARTQLIKCLENIHQTEKSMIDRLALDLKIHMEMEEEILYPALLKVPEVASRNSEMLSEHRTIRTLLEKITGKEIREIYGLDETLQSLLDAVDQHVEEEEHEIIPLFLKHVSDEEADALTGRMRESKQARQAKARVVER